jgi:hypothetical protein
MLVSVHTALKIIRQVALNAKLRKLTLRLATRYSALYIEKLLKIKPALLQKMDQGLISSDNN